jgi:hypothetical protein
MILNCLHTKRINGNLKFDWKHQGKIAKPFGQGPPAIYVGGCLYLGVRMFTGYYPRRAIF